MFAVDPFASLVVVHRYVLGTGDPQENLGHAVDDVADHLGLALELEVQLAQMALQGLLDLGNIASIKNTPARSQVGPSPKPPKSSGNLELFPLSISLLTSLLARVTQ